MRWKYRILIFLIIVVGIGATLFLGFPRAASILLSFKKTCKVMRIEPFSKAIIMNSPGQANKFALICDDGYICRAEDTGFAAVKTGDTIEFRGFPEFSTFEEFGKCDHAQITRIETSK